jgi:hypothetical protein
MLHVVTESRCSLELRGEPTRLLQLGNLALVHCGEGHALTSAPGLPAAKLFEIDREQVSERYETLRLGGDAERATVICGLFKFEDHVTQQLLALLLKIIAVDGWASPQSDWMHSTLRVIAAEAREMSPGGETVITRLADILVIHAIRFWITHNPSAQTGWLGALQDPQIGRVISKIHRSPGHPWTLESLAARHPCHARHSLHAFPNL